LYLAARLPDDGQLKVRPWASKCRRSSSTRSPRFGCGCMEGARTFVKGAAMNKRELNRESLTYEEGPSMDRKWCVRPMVSRHTCGSPRMEGLNRDGDGGEGCMVAVQLKCKIQDLYWKLVLLGRYAWVGWQSYFAKVWLGEVYHFWRVWFWHGFGS
jgi:hypothetical protein